MRSWFWVLALVLCCGSVPQADPKYELVTEQPEQPAINLAILLNPDRLPTTPAPDTFLIEVETTVGMMTFEMFREWSPRGVDRFYHLVQAGFYTDMSIFRAIPKFVVQFGIHGEPQVSKVWKEAKIEADRGQLEFGNERGTITFAQTAQPDSRTTQLFINLVDNIQLDTQGFRPLGRIIEGEEVLDAITTEYGQIRNNIQQRIHDHGNGMLQREYPNLDYILSVKIVDPERDD